MSFAGRIRSLASDAAIYGLAKVAGRFLTFFLNPFYTHVLEIGDNGRIQTLYGWIALLVSLYPLGLDVALQRFATAGERRDPRLVFSTAAWMLLAGGALFSAGIALLAGPLARRSGVGEDAGLVRLAAAILLVDSLSTAPFAWLRIRRRATAFAAVQLANILASVALNVLLVGRWRLGGAGVLQANLLASAFQFVLLLPVYERLFRPRFDRSLAREMVRFGLPLLPSNLAAQVVNAADRPLVALLAGEAAVGLYGTSHRIGMLMMLVVTVFQFAWQPFFLERGRDADARPLFARILTYYLVAAMGLFLAVALGVDWIVRVPLPGGRSLFDARYWEGLPVVPWVLLGYVAFGVYANFSAGPTIEKRTALFPVVTGSAALVNVALNLALVPRFGYRAAGWAMALAYTVMALGMWRLARRVFPVPYEWGRLARVAGFALGLWGLYLALGGAALGPVARLAILAAYPALLAASGFLTAAERTRLSRLLRPRR